MVATAILGIAYLTLYFYLGHKTWVDMMTPEDPDCLIKQELEDGTLPPWVYHLFVTFWFPLIIYADIRSLFREPRTYP